MPEPQSVVWNISLEDIEGGSGFVKTKVYSRVSDLGSSKCAFDTRHILYSKLRPYLNKVVVPDDSGVGTSELIPMLPDPKRLDREFLAYYLRSGSFLAFAQANTRGANLPRIAMTALWKHEVPVPHSLREQKRIVERIQECIERVDEIENLAAASADDAGCLQMAFRHDLWAECASDHPFASLEKVALSTKNGLYKPREHHGTGTILLRGFNVTEAAFVRARTERIELTEKELNDYSIVNDDILVSRVNSRALVGKSALVEDLQEPAVHEAMLIRLRVDPRKANPRFLVWLVNSPQFLHDLRSRAKHAIGQSSINQKDLLGSKLPLPPIGRQEELIERISNFVPLASALSTEVSGRQRAIVGLRDVVLRKAFAGEL